MPEGLDHRDIDREAGRRQTEWMRAFGGLDVTTADRSDSAAEPDPDPGHMPNGDPPAVVLWGTDARA